MNDIELLDTPFQSPLKEEIKVEISEKLLNDAAIYESDKSDDDKPLKRNKNVFFSFDEEVTTSESTSKSFSF